MIGQGRIGELISAKPRARRALLEEAAGISGLHSRRHEAELRLRAAETNLERLDDVISQFDAQLESLKRQARQANRYRNVSAEIHKSEATLFYLRWKAARQAVSEAESALTAATLSVGQKGEAQAVAAKEQAIIAHKLPKLRDAEAHAAAALQRLVLERNQMDLEAQRIALRKQELDDRLRQLGQDLAREQQMIAENSDIIDHLDREKELLEAETGKAGERQKDTSSALADASKKLAAGESELEILTGEAASISAARNQLQRTIADSKERAVRLSDQTASVTSELEKLSAKIAEQAGTEEKQRHIDVLEHQMGETEAAASEAERLVAVSRQEEEAARRPLIATRDALNEIETEARTLAGILNATTTDLFPAVVEEIKVAPGYEAALGAALGEDLDISTNTSAPVHWGAVERSVDDSALPQGAEPLSAHVSAPQELGRRLAQIGIVGRHEGQQLQRQLRPGQRLVSIEGDLWRWDGFSASAEAPTPAAQRLAQKNRFAELDRAAIETTARLRQAETLLAAAKAELTKNLGAEQAQREAVRDLHRRLGVARDDQVKAERAVGEMSNRRSALEEARVRLHSSLDEANLVHKEATASLAATPPLATLEEKLTSLRQLVATDRAGFAEAKTVHDGLARENALRSQRLEAIERERKSWIDRASNAENQIAVLTSRQQEAGHEREQLDRAPSELDERRRIISRQIETAEELRREAGDQLATTENKLKSADQIASSSLLELSSAREESARAEERLGAARQRDSEIETRIRDELECQPHELLQLAELKDGDSHPDLGATERRLEKLKAERERLGAVNLRADIEQTEIAEQRDNLVAESDDLVEAIRRLRQGIQSLNTEGRERLLTAFDAVNEEFKRLFTHLFGGGTAELQLVESDDPLEAGLEILARPPGKKPQTMTLLSGGEQAFDRDGADFCRVLDQSGADMRARRGRRPA